MGPVEGSGGVGDKDIEEMSAQPADQIQATSPSPGFRKRSPKEMGKGVLTMVTATKRW